MGTVSVVILIAVVVLDAAILYYFRREIFSAWPDLWTALQTRMGLRAYRKRLLTPKPRQVEQSLGALLPRRLLALYNDKETTLAYEFKVLPKTTHSEAEPLFVDEFLPLDAESQQSVNIRHPGKVFCFARGYESYFWLPLDQSRREDAPVYQFRVEDGQNTLVADTLEEFLSWPRVPA